MRILRDFQGLEVRLTDERLAHILEHSEMMGSEAAIKHTLAYDRRKAADVLEYLRRNGLKRPVGESRVSLLQLLERLRHASPGAAEETVLTENVANAIASGAAVITFTVDPVEGALAILDD